ncbi:hypothetical protein ACFLT2_13135 [Acidobacteriota bacterium]
MDAYISADARQLIHAQILMGARIDGFLLGHKRGHRLFVEEILPTQRGFFSSLEKYISLNTLLNERIIGFFSFNPEESTTRKILAPFAQGKLFLDITPRDSKKLDIKSYTIDFDERFYFSPIKIKS